MKWRLLVRIFLSLLLYGYVKKKKEEKLLFVLLKLITFFNLNTNFQFLQSTLTKFQFFTIQPILSQNSHNAHNFYFLQKKKRGVAKMAR
jgi:hypothetical protein